MIPHPTELPRFARDLLASPPRRGGGLNLWLYRTARVLHPYRTPSEIEHLLTAAIAGEPVKRGEIARAVSRSAATAWRPGQAEVSPPSSVGARTPPWPKMDATKRDAVTASGLGLVDLWETSPVRFRDDASYAEEIVDVLFPGNPLLCVGKSSFHFATRPRDRWRGRLREMQFIVPSPMTARTGLTQEGKVSEHSLDNTAPRRFLVIEQDHGNADEQAAVLLHLATLAPLIVAVHSGSKSIHGWFMAAGHSENQLRRFMRRAVVLGADFATWTRSQFVRMPGGTHDNGHPQTAYFFNSEVRS